MLTNMKTYIKKKFRGVSSHRWKSNPLEKLFAEAWQDQHAMNGRHLDHLLTPASEGPYFQPIESSERDHEVAATVIQWLGSPVGQGFLEEVLKEAEHRGIPNRLKLK